MTEPTHAQIAKFLDVFEKLAALEASYPKTERWPRRCICTDAETVRQWLKTLARPPVPANIVCREIDDLIHTLTEISKDCRTLTHEVEISFNEDGDISVNSVSSGDDGPTTHETICVPAEHHLHRAGVMTPQQAVSHLAAAVPKEDQQEVMNRLRVVEYLCTGELLDGQELDDLYDQYVGFKEQYKGTKLDHDVMNDFMVSYYG